MFFFTLLIRGIFAPMQSSTHLPVMEQFYTLQGEGRYTGYAAYFIRLGGCDVGCFWCDVKESWDAEVHPKLDVQELAAGVEEAGADRVVVTGGEPTLHNMTQLTAALKARNLSTHLETAGVHPLTGEWDWITFSPKKFKNPRPEFYKLAHELKVVVYNKHDLEWAESHAALAHPDCLLYLQPEWDRREEILPMMLNYVRDNPQWVLSQQTHKYIGIP